MKFIIITCFLILSALGANAVSDFDSAFGRVPTVSQKEAEAIKDAATAPDAKSALTVLKSASENQWAGAGIFFNLANLYAAEQNYDMAISNYKKSLEKLPSFFMAQKNLGFVYAKNGNLELAYSELKKALALSGGSDTDILLWLTSRYADCGDFTAALSCCNQALIYSPMSHSAQIAKARILLELGMFKESQWLCQKLLADNIKDSDALSTLILARAKNGDYIGSIAACRLLKALHDSAKLPLNLGDLYYNVGLYSNAVDCYSKDGNQDKTINALLAMIYSDDAQNALKYCPKISSSVSHKLQAFALSVMGKKKEAFDEFAAYFKTDPDDSVAANFYAQLALEQKEYQIAEEFFTRAMSDTKLEISAMYGLMRVAIARDDTSEALKIARRIFAKTKNLELQSYIKYLDEQSSQ